MIDGGICSQMYQYLIGLYFMNRGYKVKYNLKWYKDYGMDVKGEQIRNFDLLKAFPYLSIKKPSSILLYLYEKSLNNVGKYPIIENWINIKSPVYMSGYYCPIKDIYKLFNTVFNVNREVLDVENRRIYDQIDNNSVAIHVRRGDLSSEYSIYGKPVTVNYFVESIIYIKKRINDPVFYFFSDDKMYLIEYLIPLLPLNLKIEVLNNDSSKGYIDLFLISKCAHQITSKGTLGKYGALLNKNPNKIIILDKDDVQVELFKFANTKIILL